ncbi:MAG: hypothetical protein M1832_001667 [Thelocarpon impressellum]|nr:MAG: hypothetical protein M1832_001667 [Thelocarpon impressellum]
MNPSGRQQLPPGTRPPLPPPHSRSQSQSQPVRPGSSSSDSSISSHATAPSPAAKRSRSPYPQTQGVHGSTSNLPSSSPAWRPPPPLQNFSRPSISLVQQSNGELQQTSRGPSPLTLSTPHHPAPQHGQGFFEPSLPTASASSNAHGNMAPLTASQIAAQAAMQHQQPSSSSSAQQQQQQQQHMRKRSQTTPSPVSPPGVVGGRRKPTIPTPIQTGRAPSSGAVPSATSAGLHYLNGSVGGPAAAAATAANAAYPRSAHSSPGFAPQQDPVPPMPDREVKPRPEKSKMKLFSKQKSIGITKDKDLDKKDRALPSPNRPGIHGPSAMGRMANASTTSLADSVSSGVGSSIYGTANNSTATLVPNDKGTTSERHKHHFLSRQKHKHKDKDEHHHLPLSSASSNSKPLDPNAPQSLYSFAPSSPSPAVTTFAKSVSGLDLRHGGRALREKKKEEKAFAMDTTSRDGELPFPGASEWPGPANMATGPSPSFMSPLTVGGMAPYGTNTYNEALGLTGLQGIGLAGMTADDAWPFLKAKLLVIFEGDDLRLPIEDFNRLVSAHLQRCVQKRTPTLITEDLRDLLQTGFSFLDQTLRSVPDERLVRNLVDMWLVVFGTILPYLQAVFLPLDLEFKGAGPLMSAREAHDFWGALPPGIDGADNPLGDALDVRRIVLLAYRDTVILPRHDTLKAIFSRLSLESINGGPTPRAATGPSAAHPIGSGSRGASPDGGYGRPGTAMSLDPGLASFSSQSSTLLGGGGVGGGGSAASLSGARSRATSNTSSALGTSSSIGEAGPSISPRPRAHLGSAPPLPTPFLTPSQPQNAHQAQDSARVTETVGRMLQCVAVLGSVQSADAAQAQMEGLAKTLKLNWLGRGRTGRNRRGFVGTRVVGVRGRGAGGGGSPTPRASIVGTDGQGGAEDGRAVRL